MDAELVGDGAHAPVLGEVQAQDLRLVLIADRHRAPLSVPCARTSTPAPAKTHELTDRTCTEMAACRGGRLGGHRRARRAPENSMAGQWSTARGRWGTVMRHFVSAHAFAASVAVAPLALRMTVPATPRLLVATPSGPQRFASGQAATSRPAVLLAAITARADEHLALAPGTHEHSGIVHRSPRRGGLDAATSPGNTALGAVRKCGPGRSLGRGPPVLTVRGCVSLFAESDLTPNPDRRHRRRARRLRPLMGDIGSVTSAPTTSSALRPRRGPPETMVITNEPASTLPQSAGRTSRTTLRGYPIPRSWRRLYFRRLSPIPMLVANTLNYPLIGLFARYPRFYAAINTRSTSRKRTGQPAPLHRIK